jgi:long-chain acyl-CoA synthetase
MDIRRCNMGVRKPWLKFYEPHVPERLEYPDKVLPALLRETAQQYPERTAIIFRGTTLSYREFDAAVDRFAAALRRLGVGAGTRVAVHLVNCPQFPIAFYGALRAGTIVVPCNPIYTARELRHQLLDSGSELIVTLSSTYKVVSAIRSDTPLKHVVVAKIKTYFPPLLRLLFALLRENKMGHRAEIAGDANTYWFDDLLSGAGDESQVADVSLDDTAVLMYTGGTTGISKGAQLTHRNVMVNAFQVNAWVGAGEGEYSVLSTLPLFHSYGMTMCMNSSVVGAGAMILIADPRDTDNILDSIQKYRPTYYPGVPAMYVAINSHPEVGKYDLSSIRSCSSGAAALPVEVQQRFQRLTGARLVEGYGLSEASPVTHGNPAFGEDRIGTIGLPWPDTEAKIVDADAGYRELQPGEVGELCVRGPQVMVGYWGNPEETANVLRRHPDGGGPWLHTGDLATMDEDGYFRIVDRKKDMILGAGGFNVYPREIEDVLYEHPQVLEAAAVGVPAGERGERPKIFVVLKPGADLSAEELLEFCRENLAPYKVPKSVEFRDSLPKTLVGKVLRRALLEEVRQEGGDL